MGKNSFLGMMFSSHGLIIFLTAIISGLVWVKGINPLLDSQPFSRLADLLYEKYLLFKKNF